VLRSPKNTQVFILLAFPFCFYFLFLPFTHKNYLEVWDQKMILG
jgi:hypothetical protein